MILLLLLLLLFKKHYQKNIIKKHYQKTLSLLNLVKKQKQKNIKPVYRFFLIIPTQNVVIMIYIMDEINDPR